MDSLAPTDDDASRAHVVPRRLWPLMLGALGVVYGDIGTSPLYTMRECLAALTHEAGAFTPRDVIEVLSLIFWALTLVITVKYLTFIVRADNRGEGGIFALLALLPERLRGGSRDGLPALTLLVIFGAALLYGDGAITPAISVLSAVEGLRVAQPELSQTVVLVVTVAILIALFAVQRRGTGAIGALFGPVMLVWFLALSVLGIWQIARYPAVLAALSPHHAVGYFFHHGPRGFLILAAVVLAVTGGEALYADLGHFGRTPMRRAWLMLVMPALVLSYFGQAALVLRDPSAADNPFFHLVPTGPATVALVALSSIATVIASQALISGIYSLTRQAMQLGLFPRVSMQHTAAEQEGQIYSPEMNTGLAIACIALVVIFRESSALAAAYGIAVTGTMTVTSVVYVVVLVSSFGWPRGRALALLVLFLALDLPFLIANLTKISHGGAAPVLMAAALTLVMVVWREGRRRLAEFYVDAHRAFDESWQRLEPLIEVRTPGLGIFMASTDRGLPPMLPHIVARTHVLPEMVLLLTVQTESRPTVPLKDRVAVTPLGHGFTRMILRFGYMETPDVPRALRVAVARRQLAVDLERATYYLARERVLGGGGGEMPGVLESLFGFLQRNAVNADRHFRIPNKNVIELGQLIDL